MFYKLWYNQLTFIDQQQLHICFSDIGEYFDKVKSYFNQDITFEQKHTAYFLLRASSISLFVLTLILASLVTFILLSKSCSNTHKEVENIIQYEEISINIFIVFVT